MPQSKWESFTAWYHAASACMQQAAEMLDEHGECTMAVTLRLCSQGVTPIDPPIEAEPAD